MRIRCIRAFRDLRADGRPMRSEGEVWEAGADRLAELNRAGYGRLAEAVPDWDGPEPSEAAERPAERASAPQTPTLGELEAMTVRQLVELCILEGVVTQGRPRKAELLEALSDHYGLG